MVCLYEGGSRNRLHCYRCETDTFLVEGEAPYRVFSFPEASAYASSEFLRRGALVDSVALANGNDPGLEKNRIREHNRKHVNNILTMQQGESKEAKDADVFGSGSYIRPLDWHFGCSPTAGAVVVNYWYFRSKYGRLNEYYYTRYDDIQDEDWDCHVSRSQKELSLTMQTDGSGGTYPWNIYSGIRDYIEDRGFGVDGGPNWEGSAVLGWHINRMKDDIDAGYPFVFSYNTEYLPELNGHSVAAYGYFTNYDDEFIIRVIDNGDEESINPVLGWNDVSGGDGPYICNPDSYKIKLLNPQGGQDHMICSWEGVYYTGQTLDIRWSNYQNPSDFVEIYFSDDGGITWTLIDTTADNGSYHWVIPGWAATYGGRIMVKQNIYITIGGFTGFIERSSSGSHGDFIILNPPEVISPNGGNTYEAGDCININLSVNAFEYYSVCLLKDGQRYATIADTIYGIIPLLTFRIPATCSGNNFQIEVRSLYDPDVYDISDTCFSIYKNPVSFSNAWMTDMIDLNGNGAYEQVKLHWDANVAIGSKNIRVDVKIKKKGTPYCIPYSSVYYTLQGSTYDDQSITIFAPSDNAGLYQFYLTAYDFKCNDSAVAAQGIYPTSPFLAIPLQAYEPTLEVLSPNGGEYLLAGDHVMMNWNSNMPGNVKIELLKAGILYTTISTSTENDGTFGWIVPSSIPSANDYRIKISGISGISLSDQSNSNFTILQNTEFSIADAWVTDKIDLNSNSFYERFKLHWNPNTNALNQTIYAKIYSKLHSASSYTFLYQTPYYTITLNQSDDHNLVINALIPLANSYDFKIEIYLKQGDLLVASRNATQDASLSAIPMQPYGNSYLSVTFPNGGESLKPGQSYTISYNTNVAQNVTIGLYRESALYQTIISSTPSSGFYNWTVPPDLAADIEYKIRVHGSSAGDYSNSNFTVNEEIYFNCPNAGMIVRKGQHLSIEWQDNLDENVDIHLYNSYGLVATVVLNTPSDGAYLWTVPGTLSTGNDYTIKITSTQHAVLNQSSEMFTIKPPIPVILPVITITSPDGGDSLYNGQNYSVQWWDNIDENVSIDLLRADTLLLPIVGSTESDGEFIWYLDDSFPAGNELKIRITSIDDSTIFTTSEDPFNIISNISVSIANVEACPDEILVPVMNSRINCLGELVFNMEYDTTIFEFTGISNINPLLAGHGNFITENSLNQIHVYYQSDTQFDAESDTLFCLSFTGNGGYSNLSWVTTDSKVYDIHQYPLSTNFSDGSIQILAAPGQAGLISGPDSVNPGEVHVYYTSMIENASGFTWEFSGDGTTLNYLSDTSISISFGFNAVSGSLTASAFNSCNQIPGNNSFVSPPLDIIVAPTPMMRLIYPTGNEAFRINEQVFIQWNNDCGCLINILLVKADSVIAILEDSVLNYGYRLVTIPDVCSGDDYRIRIHCLSDNQISDESDDFIIYRQPEISIPETQECAGNIMLPIIAKDIVAMDTFQFILHYDTAFLSFSQVSSPYIQAEYLNIAMNNTGLQVTGSATNPLTILSDTLLLLHFTSSSFSGTILFDTASIILNNMGIPFDAAFLNGIVDIDSCSEIHGNISYLNQTNTAMPGVILRLLKNNLVFAESVSGQDGSFNLDRIPYGNYKLISVTDNEPGGINAADALVIMNHYVQISSLTGLPLLAADLNGVFGINSVDALLALRRYVGLIDTFDVGDWVSDTLVVELNTSVPLNCSLSCLCYGDVNCSFIPLVKMKHMKLLPAVKGELFYTSGKVVDIPVFLQSEKAIGSVSLCMNYNVDDYQIHEIIPVQLTDSDANSILQINHQPGEIRLGWSSIQAVELAANTPIILLRATIGRDVLQQSFTLQETAITGTDAKSISGSEIQMPKLKHLSVVENFNIVPNPTTYSINVLWDNPKDEFATLFIFDLLGEVISSTNFTLTEKQFSLSTQEFISGVYQVCIQTHHGSIECQKIVIIK